MARPTWRAYTALVLVLCAVQLSTTAAACPKGAYNEKICSGHGACNQRNLCECDANHLGFDCSQVKCPLGPAWAAPARATNDAHYPVECSNRGICDRQKGICQCMAGYTGTACQRLTCASDCSEAGECLSLKQLSRVFAVGNEPIYEQVWDADMMYGCKCRKGHHGFDCSKMSCPRGDDPLTTGQANDMQVLQCTARSGFFYLFFNGVGTTVPWDATDVQLAEILQRLEGFPKTKVTYTAGTRACSDTQPNAILVEFVSQFGPQPPIKVFNQLNGIVTLQGGQVQAASGGAPLAGRVSIKGSKEWAFCSNRGDCDETSGQCNCYVIPMPGFRSSDGYGNHGLRGDCGSANDQNKYGGPIKACAGELACNGHGYCAGSPSFRCICERGWVSGDCSERTCPQGPSWFTAPSITNVVHSQWAVCSNAGICDRATGECQCYSPFTGDACDLLKCPGEPTCGGHGRCLSVRQLSLEADVDDPSLRFDYGTVPNDPLTFDRDSVLGCKCDPGYEGYDCSLRSCPRGDDPTTTGQVDEVKILQCIANGGSFQLQYRLLTSTPIPFDATASQLRDILVNSLLFADVTVEFNSGATLCSLASAPILNVATLTFQQDHGRLPPLRIGPNSLRSNAVAPAVPLAVANDGVTLGGISSRSGTKENAVCSNKGFCNYDTGVCQCLRGYASSDGLGKSGTRGDCGHLQEKAPRDA